MLADRTVRDAVSIKTKAQTVEYKLLRVWEWDTSPTFRTLWNEVSQVGHFCYFHLML